MLLHHYLQLLRQLRKWVLAVILVSTLLSALVNALRLSMSPVYTATASVAVLPTEAEYIFGRQSGEGPRSTTRDLTATYSEYLRSRPVVEAALDKIRSGLLQGAPGQGWIEDLARGTLDWLRQTYRKLDSGRYVPVDAREAALQQLTDAIDLETVADSYILRIAVNLPSPEVAAAAANALAEAYVQRVSEQLANSVGQIGGFLQQAIAVREAELKALTARQDQLRSGAGMASLEAEQARMLTTREMERQKLIDAQAELQSAEAELSVLNGQNIVQSGRSVAELNTARALATARHDAALRNLELRKRTADQLNATVEALRSKEEPLAAVGNQYELVRAELAELHNRLLSTDLTRSSALTQVRVIDPAVVPVYPSSPHVIQDTLLGLLAGILLGLALVVVVDAASDDVRTTADLERIAGRRSLGVLPRRLLVAAAGTSKRGDATLPGKLRALGTRLERGLTMMQAFEASAIQVTGFVGERGVADTAIVMAASLASRGRRVVCRVPGAIPPPGTLREAAGGDLLVTSDGSDDKLGFATAIRIKCLGPVSAELSFSSEASRSPALVCVVPAGKVQERDVKDFQEAALAAGFSALSFVMLES